MGVFEMPPFDEGTKAVAQAGRGRNRQRRQKRHWRRRQRKRVEETRPDKKVTHISTAAERHWNSSKAKNSSASKYWTKNNSHPNNLRYD